MRRYNCALLPRDCTIRVIYLGEKLSFHFSLKCKTDLKVEHHLVYQSNYPKPSYQDDMLLNLEAA